MFTNRGFELFPAERPAARPGEEQQLLAIDFDDELLAKEALLAAARLGKRQAIALDDAAIVTRSRSGRTRILQTRDKTPAQGALLGGWWGGLAGLFALGFGGWLVGGLLGAVAGGIWAHWRDIGIDDRWMRRLGDTLAPGHAAFVIAVRHAFPTNLIRELRRFQGRLLHNSVRDVDTAAVEDALAYMP